MIDNLKDKYSQWANELKGKAENYVAFTRFPKYLRVRIKSINQSENIHKELERIRMNSGGYFQSEKILWIKWYLFIEKLQKQRWSNPDALMKGYLRQLYRIFRDRFEKEEQLVRKEVHTFTQNY